MPWPHLDPPRGGRDVAGACGCDPRKQARLSVPGAVRDPSCLRTKGDRVGVVSGCGLPPVHTLRPRGAGLPSCPARGLVPCRPRPYRGPLLYTGVMTTI
eukprot:1178238-Prorocentrum_minimum.AAC.2